VKRFSILAVILGTACIATASPPTVEELWSHLFTNGPVVWQAPTNNLPKSFWTYKKILPQVFSSSVISNAIVLASLQKKGFPQPSTNQIIIWEPSMENLSPNTDDPLAGSFSILPDQATISYSMPHFDLDSGKDIPSDEAIVKRARNSAVQLGLDPLKLMQKPLTFHVCSFDENGHDNTNSQICGRRIYLSRQIDGFSFYGDGDNFSGGFWMEFGSHGKVRGFCLSWPTLQRNVVSLTASPEQIVTCIKSHKTFVMPNGDEAGYFARLKTLASAKKLTVTKITPYYGEGTFGEVPTNDAANIFVTPYAELEAVADFGNSNATVRLVSPILSSEVTRLLGSK